jgi:group I intron endonuclease
MEEIIWYNLDEKGFIRKGDNKSLLQGPGIYAYRLKLDKNKVYVGSAVNVAQRFRQHRYRCSIYKSNNSKFYNLVIKYGWNNIQFGIIEQVSFPTYNSDIVLNKKLLLDREQYYLDKYLPSLNINRFAKSILDYKHTKESRIKFSSSRTGKVYGKRIISKSKPLVSKETIDKLKLRTKGAPTCLYDKSHNLLQRFKTIKDAAKCVGLSPSSVSKYITKNTIWNDRYYFGIKENK